MSDASNVLRPLYAINSVIGTVERQRISYNDMMAAGLPNEAKQQLQSIQSQLQSIMSAYNSTLDNINAALNDLPEVIASFWEV